MYAVVTAALNNTLMHELAEQVSAILEVDRHLIGFEISMMALDLTQNHQTNPKVMDCAT